MRVSAVASRAEVGREAVVCREEGNRKSVFTLVGATVATYTAGSR